MSQYSPQMHWKTLQKITIEKYSIASFIHEELVHTLNNLLSLLQIKEKKSYLNSRKGSEICIKSSSASTVIQPMFHLLCTSLNHIDAYGCHNLQF